MKLKEKLCEVNLERLKQQMSENPKLCNTLTSSYENLNFKYQRLVQGLTEEEKGKNLLYIIERSIYEKGEECNFFSEKDGKLLGWIGLNISPFSPQIIRNIKMFSFDVDDTDNNSGEFYDDLTSLLQDLVETHSDVQWHARKFTEEEIAKIKEIYGEKEARKANILLTVYKRIIRSYKGSYIEKSTDVVFNIHNPSYSNSDTFDFEDLEESLSRSFDDFGWCYQFQYPEGMVYDGEPVPVIKEKLKKLYANYNIGFRKEKDRLRFVLREKI